jgi:imidazolonepropionase-like amidohydrolase
MRLVWALTLAAGALARDTVDAGEPHARFVIRNAMIVEGVGTPPYGPRDILVEKNRIAAIGTGLNADKSIDATGKYVLPGLINMHGHIQHERGGQPMDPDYCLKLWLAAGITTVRDVGSDFEKARNARALAAQAKLAAPRLFLYRMFPSTKSREEAVATVRRFKEEGADGIKHLGTYRDVMESLREEAKAQGLRTAHHAGVEETNAWDDIRLGTTSIEHWYGIPDAALGDGVQHFPPGYNYLNETDRFRYAGRLWREADPAQLTKVLKGLARAGVAWDPTLNIYEAARDLQRAQNQPWFGRYLHPALERFFRPSQVNHGSFFFGWTTADEVYWRENYRLWMAALRQFEELGGVITTGEDAGFIYQMQGFGLIRELELHQEAGFTPLAVLKHATYNGARVLGKETEIGRVRTGWLADLIVVNGNPLANFKLLYPTGQMEIEEGREVTAGRVEWTIKDGIPYHAPTLLEQARKIVEKARKD